MIFEPLGMLTHRATMFNDSVALRVQMISFCSDALMNLANFPRDAEYLGITSLLCLAGLQTNGQQDR